MIRLPLPVGVMPRDVASSSSPPIFTCGVHDHLIAARAAQSHSVLLTNGCFDLLHVGHVLSIEYAIARLRLERNSNSSHHVVVAVNSDSSVRELKGPDRPVLSQEHRAFMLSRLACVNTVVVFDTEAQLEWLISVFRPRILFKGSDWEGEAITGGELVSRLGGSVLFTPSFDVESTSDLINRLRDKPTQPTTMGVSEMQRLIREL